MDRETIYLDNDEEITSVVDKLKGANNASIDLVVPKEALLLQSVVNLKLLKKQAGSLGKEIAIVTQDKVGKKLAEQIGIPVIANVGDAPKEMHVKEAEPATAAVAPIPTEEDIEFKEERSESSDQRSGETELEDDEAVEKAPAAEPVKEAPKPPKPEKDGKKWPWKKIGIIGGFAALVLFVMAYILVPLAHVNLTMAAEKKRVDLSFTADKNAAAVDGGNETIPSRLINEDKEVSKKYPATGTKKVGTNATGTATIYNNGYDSDPISIIAGTRLVTDGGLIFKTNANVTLPGSYLDGGNIVVTSIEVTVTADQVGGGYNIAAAANLSIPALGTSKVYGKSKSAFSGGTSRDVKFVSQTDINGAKDDLSKQLEDELKRLSLEKTNRDERLLDNAWKITQISSNPSVAVNGEADEFTLTAKSNVKALVFKDDDLKRLAESSLGDQIGSTKEIIEKDALASTAEFTDADFDKGQMHAHLTGEAYIATKLDQDKIKTELSGDSEANATAYLKNLDGVDDANIKFFPSFYKRMPRIKKHIYIKITINKNQG